MKSVLEEKARARIKACVGQQERTIEAVRNGVPRLAEPDVGRAIRRLEAESLLVPDAALVRQLIETPADDDERERIWGQTTDFVGVAFLERGMNAGKTVGRVAFRDGRPQGTGFLIAPGLFLTNNHVIDTETACRHFTVEFDYEIDGIGRRKDTTRLALDPDAFFITDDTDDLDFTIVAVGHKLSGPKQLSEYGFTALSAADNKHALGDVANVIQHPDGRFKEVVLRENRVVSRLSHVLHYVADTEPGSSGSPVFNNQWQVIALHHWGGPWRQRKGPDGLPVPRYVNEGIRTSAIVDEIKERRRELSTNQRRRLDEALLLGESTTGVPVGTELGNESSIDAGGAIMRPDGSAMWRIPIEISVSLPNALVASDSNRVSVPRVDPPPQQNDLATSDAERFRRRVDRDYDNRKGYRERFLRGHRIPLPNLAPWIRARAAPNQQAAPGDDPLEIPYQHFSVYVDASRGLPLLTACNIDGKNLKKINRRTGEISNAESLEAEAEGAEAREKWYNDPRLDPGHVASDDLYLSQVVAHGRNRLDRIFHRGHMVRRLDPCWGTDRNALRAEADTFHFTNCTPQVGRFNSRRSLWLGIENHVLNNARSDDIRMSVFTGPVLREDDPPYRQHVFPDFKVPLRFWKIVVWVENGTLSTLAFLADQSPVLNAIPGELGEDIGEIPEAIEEFVSAVTHIEELIDIDFGADVRDADRYEMVDAENVRDSGKLMSIDELRIGPRPTPKSKRRPRGRS